jgi:hypothetical protein
MKHRSADLLISEATLMVTHFNYSKFYGIHTAQHPWLPAEQEPESEVTEHSPLALVTVRLQTQFACPLFVKAEFAQIANVCEAGFGGGLGLTCCRPRNSETLVLSLAVFSPKTTIVSSSVD